MYLQVVFRGKLGQESDAVAVTTKDIVEPNYIAVANMTDYVYDDTGDNHYHPVPFGGAGGSLGVSNFGVAVPQEHVLSPDLSGEFGGDPIVFTGLACRSKEEFVAVSRAVAVADGEIRPTSPSRLHSCSNRSNVIPIDMSDAYLQVVFRGKLGQEADAVAVTTKDIAEPNFIAVANMTDYVYDDIGDNKYHSLPYQTASHGLGCQQLRRGIRHEHDASGDHPGLGGGQHAQIAFLTDAGDLPATIFFSGIQDTSWILQPEEFKLDDVTQKFERSCKVFLARGLYREYQYWFYQRVSDHALSWKIQNVGSGGKSSTGNGGGQSRMHPQAAHDCGVPTGGVYDFSTMTPFTTTNALPWTINF